MKESTSAKKSNKKRWVRLRHRVVFAVLRPVFKVFLRLKYNYRAIPSKLSRKRPYLVLCNHQALLDMFMVAESFKFPLYYFASEDIFNLGWKSKAIRYLVAPIPKSKNVNDLRAVLDSRRIVSEGGSVCIFVEGNRTYSGELGYIDMASAKLAKMLNIPVVLYTFRGGYGVDPRWGAKARKGRMEGSVARILSPEETQALSVPELREIIETTLKVSEVPSPVPVKSPARAEYLERALYYCPACGAFESMKSRGDLFRCDACGFAARYESDLTFAPATGELPASSVAEWRKLEIEALRARLMQADGDERIFTDRDMTITRTLDTKRALVDKGEMTLTKNELRVGDTVFPMHEIIAVSAQSCCELLLYHGKETYQIKGDPRFSPVKYTHAFYLARQIAEGVSDEYLGGV